MNDSPAFRDPSISTEDRIADLLSRMTLEEKAAQTWMPFGMTVDLHSPPEAGWGAALAALSSLDAPPREMATKSNELQRKHVEDTRLGIPTLIAEEALIGFKVRDATTFPDAIAQAATWNPRLIEKMGRTIGSQMALLGVRQALSPLADVARDPRWGRVEETYGEEPYLVGSMATAFVRGLQNAVEGKPIMATLKHFIAYGASDGGRNTEPVQLGERELREIHTLPFEMAIRDGGARGVMPSYNDIDGVPVTGSKAHLTDLLRDELDFNGLVTSDLGAVNQLFAKHATADGVLAAVAQARAAGVDLELESRASCARVVDAVNEGFLSEADLDRAAVSVLRAKFQLGPFEDPYIDLDAVPETLDSDEARALARTIAEQSVILLQNKPVGDAPLLPLSPSITKIAVIGPNADRPMGQLGNYSYQVLDSMSKGFALAADPQAKPQDILDLMSKNGPDDAQLRVGTVPLVTFLDGIRGRVGDDVEVIYEQGCQIATDDRSGFDAAVRAATAAEVAVVVVGDQSGITALGTVGEGLDSSECALPGVQRELVEAIVATGTPTIVVLSHGRPYVLGWMADTVPAILSSFFAGEEAGNAVASILFGDVNPAGRLPIALLSSVGAAPVPYWRTLQGPGYIEGSTTAVFPFGHGESYTDFEYRDLRVHSAEVPTNGVITVSFTLANTGPRDGDEVVQVYGNDTIARTARRGRVLLAFERVHLAAGSAARITVEVPATMLALWDAADGWLVEPGRIKLYIGGSSAETPLRGKVRFTGDVSLAGRDRSLFSTVTVDTSESALVLPAAPASAPPGAEVPTIGADNMIREWLEHPVGADVLLAALGVPDEDMLASSYGMTLAQIFQFSFGRYPDSLLDDILTQTRALSQTSSISR